MSPQVDWLREEDFETITTDCLRIESESPRDWLPKLYDAFAHRYLAAGAPHGEKGLIKDIPVLVYDQALKMRWFSIPRTRPVRGAVRAVFSLFDSQLTLQSFKAIPLSEFTMQFGKHTLPPWHVQQFAKRLDRRVRYWLAELREQKRTQPTGLSGVTVSSAITVRDQSPVSTPASVENVYQTGSRSVASPSDGVAAKLQYSGNDEKIYELIKREPFFTMTNSEIDVSFRAKLRARFPRPGTEALRACLSRIRRHHAFPSSESIRKNRSAAADNVLGNRRPRRSRKKAVKN